MGLLSLRWAPCHQPHISALAMESLMRNFLNSVSCHALRGCFKFGSLFMGALVARSFSSQLLASALSNHSLFGRWYSLGKRWSNLLSVAARSSFALQARNNSQFRARQAQEFSGNLLALTITSKWTVKRCAFASPCCRR